MKQQLNGFRRDSSVVERILGKIALATRAQAIFPSNSTAFAARSRGRIVDFCREQRTNMRYNLGDIGEVGEMEQRRRNAERFVYFVRAKGLSLIKIGVANDVTARFAALVTNSPVRLQSLGVIRSRDALVLEGSLHGRFGWLRSHGEWFRAHTELTDYIKERAVSLDEDRAGVCRAVVAQLRSGPTPLEIWRAEHQDA